MFGIPWRFSVPLFATTKAEKAFVSATIRFIKLRLLHLAKV